MLNLTIGITSKQNNMATYNCTDSDSAYGSGSFGTCTGQAIGAPDTGVFEQVFSGGSFSVLLPVVVAVVLVAIAIVFARRTSTRRSRNR